MSYLRGSIWRKWDLQVQPAKGEWFLNFDPEDSRVKSRVDSFLQEALNKGFQVIGITDHNFGGCIDVALSLIDKHNYDLVILPGVELNTQEGWHVIIIFNPEYKNKVRCRTWNETVKNFLSFCQLPDPFDPNGNARPVGVTTVELIRKVFNEDIGIVVFSHCLSRNDGFFKRGNNASRREVINLHLQDGIFFVFDSKTFDLNIKGQIEKEIQDIIGNSNYKLTLPIISTSDAHSASDVGQYYTWIKADPTYEGLKQILYEPEERVFIGEEPELLRRLRENPTKFIKSIFISQTQGYDGKMGVWFKDIKIPINPGLVAIIGNKGAGKSALLDIIALCGNSHQYKEFSFLTENRFKKDGLAKNFEATLEWEDGEKIFKNLGNETDITSPERVKYLPQNYFERLTNALETYEFEKTLENVVFSYLPEDKKLGKNSFEELINYKKGIIDQEIEEILKDINKLNEKIIKLEKKEHPNYKKRVEKELQLKKKELAEFEKIKPKEVKKPVISDEITEELQKLKEKLKQFEKEIELKKENNVFLSQEIEDLDQIKKELKNLQKQFDNYLVVNETRLKKYGLDIKNLVQIKLNLQPIIDLIRTKQTQYEKNLQDIEKLSQDKKEIETKIKKIQYKLSEEHRLYEKYLENLKKWEEKRKEIIGDESKPNTIKWLEKELAYLEKDLRKELEFLRQERISRALAIYDKKIELVNIYKSFKDYVDKEISDYQNILGEYEINIEVTLKLSEEFYDKFLSFINQDRKGSFRGINEGKKILKELTKKFDLSTKEGIAQFLREVIEYLEYDKREPLKDKQERRYILDQISEKNIKDFYRYLFSLHYIQPVYQLKLGDKDLTQLSPGEKGALLIVFYLMLDKDNTPLLIDQPEENLDNESIYKILTHFIKLTKKKRQIIIVTHNPNLAIVGDAEQIIFVNIDKKNKNRFSFEAGAIENPRINKRASDILEGTLKAFDIRRLKYLRKIEV